jgi:hypothetical protein
MPTQYDNILHYLRIAASVAFFACGVHLFIRARQMRPRFEKSEVVYQERYASGCSQKNILTKLGGARNCLRLVVTRSFLLVASWFPFSLITPFYDLEHVIPLDSIMSVRHSSFLGFDSLLLTYRGADHEDHTLRLRPKSPDDFIRSLGVKLENETSA